MRYRGLIGVEAVWIVFAANFNVGYLWGGDSHVAYTFLRGLFGTGHPGTAYQFGLGLFETPFYGLGRVLQWAGIESVRTHPAPEFAIAAGAIFYICLAVAFAYVLLAKLGFRRPALAAGCALFGSPLFYYGTFSPGQTHAVETMLACAGVLLVYVAHQREWPTVLSIATGTVLGVAPTVRYFEGMFGIGVVLMLLLTKRWRPAAIVASSGVVTLGALLAIPISMHVPIFAVGSDPQSVLSFSPTSPLQMLFGIRRGLFFWTPLTLLAAVGLARAWRLSAGRSRWFLSTLVAMALLLVAIQASITFWYAGWSFSQRYLTALYPMVAVGCAALLDWSVTVGLALAAPAIAWSLFLCANMQTIGFDEHHDTVFSLARRAGTQTPGAYAWGVWHISHLRLLVPTLH